MLHIAYVLALFWYVVSSGNLRKTLDAVSRTPPKSKIGKLIPVSLIIILFLGEISGQLKGLVEVLILPSTLFFLIIWFREIRIQTIFIGILLTAIAFLGGLIWFQNQFFSEEVFIIFLSFITPIFVAAGLINKRAGLEGSQLFKGQYKNAAKSFIMGCMLFIPLGLANAAAGSPGPWMTWVTKWWMPFSMPFFSAIVEEANWRLMVVSLCYFLLRPAFNKYPRIAIVSSLLFSAIIFGIGHKGNLLDTFLITGLLYGLPMAVVFAERDWEHAIGAHYMINMIPTLMVFLET